MRYRTGSLRHIISVTSPTISSQNSYGEDVITNTTVGTFHCHVQPNSGMESESAGQRWAHHLYDIRMRRQPGIVFTTAMKITWDSANGDVVMDILEVQDPAEGEPWIRMLARTVDNT
jgi:head-tail adaptor